MENIWIDPALLAIPSYADEEDAHRLFSRITGFESLLMAEGVTLVLANNAEDSLWASSVGPGYEQIVEFLQMLNLDRVFTARDIFKSYQTIWDRSDRSRDNPGFEVLALDDFACDPPVLKNVCPASLRDVSELALASVALAQRNQNCWSVGSAFPDGGLQRVNVGATISLIEGPRAEMFGPSPIAAKAQVRCVTSFDDFVCTSEADRFWCHCTNAEDLFFAIALKALAIKRDTAPGAHFHDLAKFCVGSEFFSSLEANQCCADEKFGMTTLDKCAHIVAGTGLVDVDVFWVDETRKSARRRSFDGAEARRVHVTSANEGIRLMLWHTNDCLEFANVGVKHEEVIREGARYGAFATDLDVYLSC